MSNKMLSCTHYDMGIVCVCLGRAGLDCRVSLERETELIKRS